MHTDNKTTLCDFDFYANLKLNFVFTRISKVQLSIYINFKKKKRIETN